MAKGQSSKRTTEEKSLVRVKKDSKTKRCDVKTVTSDDSKQCSHRSFKLSRLTQDLVERHDDAILTIFNRYKPPSSSSSSAAEDYPFSLILQPAALDAINSIVVDLFERILNRSGRYVRQTLINFLFRFRKSVSSS